MTKVVIIDIDHNTYSWRNASGRFHRKNGPAVISPNGSERWLINGKLHRRDGPAVKISNGCEKWYINGLLHRVDGPADNKRSDGTVRWFVQGKQVFSYKAFQRLTNCSDEFIVILKLKYGKMYKISEQIPV